MSIAKAWLTGGIVALIVCGLPARAQSWETLRGLKPGDPIKVLDDGGHDRAGSFASVSDTGISLDTKKSQVTVERQHVKRVQIRSGQRRLRNVAIGAAVGVAVAVAIDQTLGTRLRNESGDGGRAITYVASIGLLGGLPAAFPGYQTVYKSK